jgi:hypothetical protein
MLYTEEPCDVCCKVTAHYNGRCGDCSAREALAKKAAHDARNESMSLEARIKSLEEWRYRTIEEWNRGPQLDY